MTERAELAPVLNTKAIRQHYRRAVQYPDGGYVGFSGYKPDDRIGHAILDTVHHLCDAVDYYEAAFEKSQENVDVILQAEARAKECPTNHGWMGWERRYEWDDFFQNHPIDEKIHHPWSTQYKHCPDCGTSLRDR